MEQTHLGSNPDSAMDHPGDPGHGVTSEPQHPDSSRVGAATTSLPRLPQGIDEIMDTKCPARSCRLYKAGLYSHFSVKPAGSLAYEWCKWRCCNYSFFF